MPTILIVDDDADFRESLSETLEDLGHDAIVVPSGAAALRVLAQEQVDAVIVDYRMPDMDGIELLKAVRARPTLARIPVAMLTAHATSANTIAAMGLGAIDHLIKPVGRQDIETLLARMLPAEDAAAATKDEIYDGPLIGSSARMRAVQKLVGISAASDATVLVTGETGTGKEIVARSIHHYGARSGRPMIAINCAAVPPTLLESELFGHVRGAFTGATHDRAGYFREASGSTLFLDEIGDMDLAMQAKLLRVLEERRITPVGSDKSVAVDVRIIAATHRLLPEHVAAGRFREDLFYRLNIMEIALPPLRERREDIPVLAAYFLRQVGNDKTLSDEAHKRLLKHSWPGNVRELKNAIERAAMLARATVITAADLTFGVPGGVPGGDRANSLDGLLDGELAPAIEALEREMIRRAVTEAGGNRTAAARRLGLHRQLLYAKLKRYGLE
jgi:DNA-binding NtrC family response regulator